MARLPKASSQVPEEEFLNMLAADALTAMTNLNEGMKRCKVPRNQRRQVIRGIIAAAND